MITEKLQSYFLPLAKFRTRYKASSSCHPERNEGSELSSPRLWLSQMLRVAQHDNFKEDLATVN